jgi:hypothetical protein
MLSEERHKELKSKLKYLPKIKARNDFYERLLIKLREHENYSARHKKIAEKDFIDKVKEWTFFIFRPNLTPAYGIAAVMLLIIVIYFAVISLNKDTTQFVYESTPVTQQSEFVIYKHQARDISDADFQLKERSVSEEFSTATFPEKHMNDVDIYRTTDRAKDETEHKERMLKNSETKNDEEVIDKTGFEQEFAPANIRKTESEKVEKKEDKIMKKKADDTLPKIKLEDKTIDRGIQEQQIQENDNKTKQDSVKVKARKLQEEPDSTRR